MYGRLVLCALLVTQSYATLQLSKTLGSSMVLQRTPHQATLYGVADSRVKITAELNGEIVASALSDRQGGFVLYLPPQEAGGPHTIVIQNVKTSETVTLEDVLFGDVWLCSGQSNQQMTVASVFNGEEEALDADNYANIRLFSIEQNESSIPLQDIAHAQLPWSRASYESVYGDPWAYFSATCYFYGRELHKRLKVPIGLIATSYGGTPIRAWSSPDVIAQCQHTLKNLEPAPAVAASIDIHVNENSPNDESVLYNAMIVPFLSMAIKGAIWYQGESDIPNYSMYECFFPAMINDWRSKFANAGAGGPFPFGFVQLAGYNSSSLGAMGIDVGFMRITQYSAYAVSDIGKVFMAPAFDLPDTAGGIHPRDKQDVSIRLALHCLKEVYGMIDGESLLAGPYITEVSAVQSKDYTISVKIFFEQVGEGLIHSDPIANLWELADEEDAVEAIEAVQIEIVSKDVVVVTFSLDEDLTGEVLYFRYALRNNPCPSRGVPYSREATCGLYNSDFLPKLPFLKKIYIEPESNSFNF